MNALSLTADKIEALEAKALRMKQGEFPLTHRFAPGIYVREVLIPKNSFVIGHAHKSECLNILLKGRIRVMIDGVTTELSAPFTFNSAPGVRKVAFAVEETVWANVHPNPANETNLEQLEAMFITKSAAFLDYENEMKTLTSGGAK